MERDDPYYIRDYEAIMSNAAHFIGHIRPMDPDSELNPNHVLNELYRLCSALNNRVKDLEAVAVAADAVHPFCASEWNIDPYVMRDTNEKAMVLGKALKEAGY